MADERTEKIYVQWTPSTRTITLAVGADCVATLRLSEQQALRVASDILELVNPQPAGEQEP